MAARKPNLRIVDGSALDATEPEQALGHLYAREAATLRELADIRDHLTLARARYAAKHRLLMWPSHETLRRLFS
jgi:hypothetical protein